MTETLSLPASAPSPAKLNLHLLITGKRPNGYHEIESLMVPLELCDTVTISAGSARCGASVSCNWPGVPLDETNLAARAARIFFENAKKCLDLEISIEKKIPPGAGLGGGSSNAATVLVLLNRIFGQPFDEPALCEMASALGADVPFFVSGKPAVARGIGELLEPVEKIHPYHVVLVYPGFGLPTGQVYGQFNFTLTRPVKIHRLRILKDGAKGKVCIETGPEHVKGFLYNDLEAPALAIRPEISAVKQALDEAGAEGSLMTGSGSSVFGLFTDREKALAARDLIGGNHESWTVFLTRISCG
jgi:4-diphosphocytidyl-2-C-methyl-D-erythritol kinase